MSRPPEDAVTSGTPTRPPVDPADAPEWARRYDASGFPRFGYTADVVGFRLGGENRDELEGLLVVRGESGPYAGMRAWPGGFVDWSGDEDGRAAALRELREETGVGAPARLDLLGIYDRYGRDPRQHVEHLPGASGRGIRVVSRAHLGLFAPDVSEPRPDPDEDPAGAVWARVYEFLPWEDLRTEAGVRRAGEIRRAVGERTGGEDGPAPRRPASRTGEVPPEEGGCGERFRSLLRASRVEEARRDPWGRLAGEVERERLFGAPLAFDHRQMLADALDVLRRAMGRRPEVLRTLAGAAAGRSALASAARAISGRPLESSDPPSSPGSRGR